MITNIFKKLLLIIFFLELASFLAFKFSSLEALFFLIFISGFLAVLTKDFRLGLSLVFLELFISPMGHHLYLPIGHFPLSLRMGMWLLVMLTWFINLLRQPNLFNYIKNTFIKKEYFIFYFLFLFIFLGLVNGFAQGHSLKIIYSDINAWFYYLLIFPIINYLPALQKNKEDLLNIFLAAFVWVSGKTLLMAYIFSHSFFTLKTNLYYWTRAAGLGEISNMPNGFVRIFFQTQIYSLIIIFYFLIKIFLNKKNTFRENKQDLIYLIIALTVTILSWARSNWLALFVVLIFYFFILFIVNKKNVIYNFLFFLFGSLMATVLALTIINIPLPRATADFNLGDLKDRMSTVEGEAAVSSRWSLLPVLKKAISQSPILGKGFGFEVEYKSSDPRILEKNPRGIFRTYIYEWGWLDLWLKLNFFGMMAYLYLIYELVLAPSIVKIKEKQYSRLIVASDSFLSFGLLIIASVHFFSPYLNHPLGIGYILFVFIFYAMPETGEKAGKRENNTQKVVKYGGLE